MRFSVKHHQANGSSLATERPVILFLWLRAMLANNIAFFHIFVCLFVIALSSCSPIVVPIDSCALVKPIQTKEAVVRGSKAFLASRDGLLDQDRDILTQSTAGQLVAQRKAIAEFCR